MKLDITKGSTGFQAFPRRLSIVPWHNEDLSNGQDNV